MMTLGGAAQKAFTGVEVTMPAMNVVRLRDGTIREVKPLLKIVNTEGNILQDNSKLIGLPEHYLDINELSMSNSGNIINFRL